MLIKSIPINVKPFLRVFVKLLSFNLPTFIFINNITARIFNSKIYYRLEHFAIYRIALKSLKTTH